MNIVRPGLQFYVRKLREGTPFTFVRYGDGEWSAAILRDRQRTGSGSQDLTNANLAQDMRESLKGHPSQAYLMSLRPGSVQKSPEILKWLRTYASRGVEWHDCRVFAHASKEGALWPLIAALRDLDLPLVFVGPSWLENLSSVFPRGLHIVIPDRDCYTSKKLIALQVLGLPRPSVISFSAGPLTKILIYELFPIIGHCSTMLDFGSLWDVFCGIRARYYQRSMSEKTITRNLTGT